MRGADRKQSQLFSYISLEDRIPRRHPLRVIKQLTDRILGELSPKFEALYSDVTRHEGYAESQRRRPMVEQGFGWGKTVGLLGKLRHRGRERVNWVFTFTVDVYDLVRMRTLITAGVSA